VLYIELFDIDLEKCLDICFEWLGFELSKTIWNQKL